MTKENIKKAIQTIYAKGYEVELDDHTEKPENALLSAYKDGVGVMFSFDTGLNFESLEKAVSGQIGDTYFCGEL